MKYLNSIKLKLIHTVLDVYYLNVFILNFDMNNLNY